MEEAVQRKSFTGSLEAQGTNRHGSWLNLRVKYSYGWKNKPRVGVPAKIEDKMHERQRCTRCEKSDETVHKCQKNRTPAPVHARTRTEPCVHAVDICRLLRHVIEPFPELSSNRACR